MNDGSKVIFLDIDGPMIPATYLLVDRNASWHRKFPETTIAVIKPHLRQHRGQDRAEHDA